MLSSFFNKSKLLSSTANRVYSARFCSGKPAETQSSSTNTSYSDIHRRLHPPNNFERKMLVWTGLYKTVDAIPQTVPVESIEKARNKMRIKVSNWMMVATLFGCVIMAITGKRAAERGESLARVSEEWHKELKQEKKQ